MVVRTLGGSVTLVRAGIHVLHAIARVGLLFPHLSEQQRREQIQRWSATTLSLFGLRLRPIQFGDKTARLPCLFIANHVSWLDVFAIWATTETQFVAKSEVADWPLIGWLARHLGVIFIDRNRRGDAAAAGHRIAGELKRGASVCIFPEGTTTEGSELQTFRPALFQAAIDAGVRVQPLAIRYLSPDGTRSLEAAFTGDTSLVQSMWRLAIAGPVIIDIAALQIVGSAGKSRRELAETCHALVQRRLQSPVIGVAARLLPSEIETAEHCAMTAAEFPA